MIISYPITCYLSAYCLVALKERLHPSLFAVATLALALDLHINLPLSHSRLFFSMRFLVFLSFFYLQVSRKELCYNYCYGLFIRYGLWISIFCISCLGSVVSSSIIVVFLVFLFHPAIWSWEFVWGCYSERHLFFFHPLCSSSMFHIGTLALEW